MIWDRFKVQYISLKKVRRNNASLPSGVLVSSLYSNPRLLGSKLAYRKGVFGLV